MKFLFASLLDTITKYLYYGNMFNKKNILTIKNQTSKTWLGFTLAEVLITLGIIGVVAALTIPTLMNNSTKKEAVVRVKKAYSLLSQATELIKLDCGGSVLGCLTNPNAVDNNDTAREEVAQLYKNKLSIIKDCTDGTTTGCFANVTYKGLNNADAWNMDTSNSFKKSRMVLSDGTAVGFDWGAGYFDIAIDINGAKSPNQMGKDLFYFGYDPSTNNTWLFSNDDCKTTGFGWGCALVIMQTDKIDYY